MWPDGSRFDLTRHAIEEHVQAMLDDPARTPPHVKAAADYQPCDICPERDKAVICHSIMAALPFMDEIDRYMSYDRVVAVFREADAPMLHVTETSMQEALKYVTILGLTHYCEVGRKYAPFFEMLAQCAGLGTVWCGMVKMALELRPELKELVGLAPGHFYYPMLFGVPAFRYARTVQRDDSARIRLVQISPPPARIIKSSVGKSLGQKQ